jgi:hypothetical protein
MQAMMRFYRHGVPSYWFCIDWVSTNVVYKIPLILLSNTDAIHIETFEQKNGAIFIVIFTTLKSLFLLWNWDAKAKLWNLQIRFEWTWFASKTHIIHWW